MFCSNCGNENSDSSVFCSNCGSKLDKTNHEKQNICTLNQINLNTNNDKTSPLLSEDDSEKEFIFKSFKAGGTCKFSRLTQVICSKKFIKITRNYNKYSYVLEKEPDELINTQEVKSVNYKLNLSAIAIVLIILCCIAALIYEGFIYAVLVVIVGIVFCVQTKISIITADKKYIIFCGTFGGRAYAKELADFIDNKLRFYP